MKCLEIAKDLAKCYSAEVSRAALKFAHWLVAALNNIIVQAQKRGKPNELNQEHLWRKYNILTDSDDFTKTWQDYLRANELDDQPVFYQHFTDELFDSML